MFTEPNFNLSLPSENFQSIRTPLLLHENFCFIPALSALESLAQVISKIEAEDKILSGVRYYRKYKNFFQANSKVTLLFLYQDLSDKTPYQAISLLRYNTEFILENLDDLETLKLLCIRSVVYSGLALRSDDYVYNQCVRSILSFITYERIQEENWSDENSDLGKRGDSWIQDIPTPIPTEQEPVKAVKTEVKDQKVAKRYCKKPTVPRLRAKKSPPKSAGDPEVKYEVSPISDHGKQPLRQNSVKTRSDSKTTTKKPSVRS